MADVQISALPAASTVNSVDVIPVVQGGVTKRANIAQLPTSGVTTVNNRNGAVTITATDVGLGNVTNTSDANKPVSTAQATALASKADYPTGGLNGQALVKNGTSTAWATVAGSSSTVTKTVDSTGNTVLTSGSGSTITYNRGVAYGSGTFYTVGTQNDPANSIPAFNNSWDYGSQATYNYLASRGHKIIRLGFTWEHVQTSLGGALNTTLLGYLQTAVGYIGNAGMRVILDCHNYGGYATQASGYQVQRLGQGVVTDAHFADLWVRLANVFKNTPAVYGYGLMNEPYDCYATTLTAPQRFALWQQSTQSVVTQIRGTGDTKRILIGKLEVSGGPKQWDVQYPTPWITDPANNFAYEQHHYSDDNHSGTYTNSYATEVSLAQAEGYASIHARDVAYLGHFLDWCKNHNVAGYIGEYGVPLDGADAGQWAAVADQLLTTLDAYAMDFTYWAVGEFWAGYTLAPYTTASGSNGVLTTARTGAAAVEAHPTAIGSATGWTATVISPDQVEARIAAALTPPPLQSINQATIILDAGDANTIIEHTGSGVLQVVVPSYNQVAWATGTVIEFFNYGSGSITFVPGDGTVGLRSPGGALRVTTQYGSAAIRNRGFGEWAVTGLVVV